MAKKIKEIYKKRKKGSSTISAAGQAQGGIS